MTDEASVEGASSSQFTDESSESTMEINIKTLDSQLYTFRVNKDLPVSKLKEKIVDATGVPVEQQRLIFRGKVLKDDHLLSAYHMEDGHTLHLVARHPVQAQPSPGTSSEEVAQNNGHGSTAAPHTRTGQASHTVHLGTYNITDTGEGIAADITRLVGAVLNSLAVGNLTSNGGASNISSTGSNQSPPSAETEAAQNASSRTQPGNFTVIDHPFQSLQNLHVPQFAAIPDSLTTLSEFINRMELVLQYGGSRSLPTDAQDPPQFEVRSSNLRGMPTPDELRAILMQVQQLITGNAASTLSHIAGRLEREGTSTDPVIRGQIQSEAIHVGAAMHNLGAMFLELGRTIMTLRMGQTPDDALVNAGPAVYISPTGPNPIMVQPSLQTTSLFGASSPLIVSGLPDPFGIRDPSRNVNIQIHAGNSVAPGVSSIGSRVNLGEAFSGEHPNVEQASTSGDGSGESVPTRGLPSRTVVAAIPALSAAATGSHVLNVIYPVHVRSQQSVTTHPSSAQASHPSVISGTETITTNPVRGPSSETDATATLVAQHNAQIANTLFRISQGQRSSSPSIRHTNSHDSSPSTNNGAQPNATSPSAQTPSETGTSRLATERSSQLNNALSKNAQDSGSSPNVNCTNSSFSSEGTQSVPPGKNDESHQAVSVIGTEVSDFSGSDKSLVHNTGMPRSVGQQPQPEDPHLSKDAHPRERFGMESSTVRSAGGPVTCGPSHSHTLSIKPRTESLEQYSDSVATIHTQSTKCDESDRPTPLGLGLGGLQPKRGKPAKSTGKVGTSQHMPSANQNQESVSRGQQVLLSLIAPNSDRNGENANSSTVPLPSVISQMMNAMPSGGQGASGQIDSSMVSNALQSPSLSSVLSGVAEQVGLGSPTTLRSMFEQCTRSPGVMNMLNETVRQVGQSEDIAGMLSEMGRANGGIDLSRMIQQMMPVVSQVLGGGLRSSAPVTDVQSNTRDVITGGNSMLNDRSSQIDVQDAVERIEQHDSPGNVFRTMLETAGRMLGEGNNYEDLFEELGNNTELTNEFMEMLRRSINQRQNTESVPKDKS